MADIIKVNDADLQQCASEYMSALEVMKDAATTYQGALDALQTDWTGAAFAAMSVHVLDFIVKMTKSFARLEDAVTELREVSSLYADREKEISVKMKGLEAGSASPFQ